MDESLASLRREAMNAALESKKLEDIKNAADTWKATSDAWKTMQDVVNQERLLRYEGLKSFATVVVPFLTLLTLLVTIWVQRDATLIQRDIAKLQADQVKATREANEDIQWREAVKTVAGSQSLISGLAAQAMLKPLLQSERYRTRATELAQAVVGRVSDVEGFRDLFDSIFIAPEWSSMKAMATVGRTLTVSYRGAKDAANEVAKLEKFASRLAPMNPSAAGTGALPSSGGFTSASGGAGALPPAFVLYSQSDAYLSELKYFCERIAAVLRAPRPANATGDLSGIMLIGCDLSNANLSGVNLTEVSIQAAGFSNVNLSDVPNFEGSGWPSTDWWRASKIDVKLLQMLSANFYPYQPADPDADYSEPIPSRESYEADLRRLCPPDKAGCEGVEVKFGRSPRRRGR